MMKRTFYLLAVCLSVLFIFGCTSTKTNVKADPIAVMKNSGYRTEPYNQITDSKKIKIIKKIVSNKDWKEDDKIKNTPSDYTFFFGREDPKNKQYSFWVEPDHTVEKLHVSIPTGSDNNEYKSTSITEKESKDLLKILIDK